MSAPEQARVPRAPRRSRRGDRTRDALVEAGLGLFAAKGVEATSVDEITSTARVAKGTFYVHFERKQDVLLEHAARFVEHLDEPALAHDLDEALDEVAVRLAASLAGISRAVCARMIREIVGQREAWLRTLGDRPTLANMIRPSIDRAQAAGTVRPDLSAARMAQAQTILWLDTVIGWAERRQQRPLVTELRQATDLFLDGARGPRSSDHGLARGDPARDPRGGGEG